MSDQLLRIGPFSRATMLSVKALRAYHERGLLVPAQVDPDTGYRAYHSSQLIDAAIIYRLRQLDLPLDAIAKVLAARDPDVTARVLAAHERAMRERQSEIEQIVADLQRGITQPDVHTGVHVRDEPAAHVLALYGKVACPGYAEFLGEAIRGLEEAVARNGLDQIGSPGGLYPPEVPHDGPDEIAAFVPVAESTLLSDDTDPAIVITELPTVRAATLIHEGGYDRIEDTYLRLGAWVAANAEPGLVNVREHYKISYTETDDPTQFRTEICWPLA